MDRVALVADKMIGKKTVIEELIIEKTEKGKEMILDATLIQGQSLIENARTMNQSVQIREPVREIRVDIRGRYRRAG